MARQFSKKSDCGCDHRHFQLTVCLNMHRADAKLSVSNFSIGWERLNLVSFIRFREATLDPVGIADDTTYTAPGVVPPAGRRRKGIFLVPGANSTIAQIVFILLTSRLV
jgi:hypothetical protein